MIFLDVENSKNEQIICDEGSRIYQFIGFYQFGSAWIYQLGFGPLVIYNLPIGFCYSLQI